MIRKPSKGFSLQKGLRNAGRFRRIVGVFSKHGFSHLAERVGLGKYLPTKVQVDGADRMSVAERLRMSFEELGPTFIKLGQLLATRPDLIPNEFIEEFKKLQSDVPALPIDKIRSVLNSHYNGKVDQLFQEISAQPLGAASIAQVHRAVLSDGRKVVLKVQRPGIDKTIEEDLNVIYALLDLFDSSMPELQSYNLRLIIDEFFRNLELETNFVVEANNIRRMADNFKDLEELVFPEVYLDLSGEKVLVMQELEGAPLSHSRAMKLVEGHSQEMTQLILKIYFQMVFKDGFFHGDLHPGNVFVFEDQRIGLIDFGVIGRLNEKTKNSIASMLISLATEDYESLAYEYVDLAPFSEDVDVDELARGLRDLISPFYGLTLNHVNAGKLLLDSARIAGEHKLVLPSELILFFRSIINIDAIGRLIKKDFDFLSEAIEFADELLQTKFNSKRLTKELTHFGRDLNALATSLPRDIRKLLRRVNSPNYVRRHEIVEMSELRRTVQMAGHLLFLGLVIVGLLVSAALSLAHPNGLYLFGQPAFSVVGFIAAALLGLIAFYNYIKS